MIPDPPAPKTASTRLVLLCLLAGSLVGAMLGAAVGFIWSQSQSGPSVVVPASSDAQAEQQLLSQLAHLQSEIKELRQHTGLAIIPELEASDASGAAPKSGEAGAQAALSQDFINQVASQIAAPARARFKEPDYEAAMQRLSAAGFSAYDAERIFALEAEAQLRYIDVMTNPAMRGRATVHEIMADLAESQRSYLGDYGYENYLRSRKLPTTVKIRSVEEESSGAAAGLQKGDEIVRYNGRRVFSIQGLNRVVKDGQPGESVSVEVLRAGKIKTVEMRSGEIGITSRPLSPRAVFDLQ